MSVTILYDLQNLHLFFPPLLRPPVELLDSTVSA